MADANQNDVIGFIASTVETILGRLDLVEQRMATKEDLARLDGEFDEKLARLDGAFDQKLARLDGRFTERLRVATSSIRGDIEQVQLRLDSMEHSLTSRFEHVEGEISRLRSAVYVLGKDQPDVLRLLGHSNPEPTNLMTCLARAC